MGAADAEVHSNLSVSCRAVLQIGAGHCLIRRCSYMVAASTHIHTMFSVAAMQVWALDVDPAEERLVVGAADAELHCFRLRPTGTADGGGASTPEGVRGDLLEAAGGLRRTATERVAALRFDAGGRLLAVQSAGRVLEVFRCACVGRIGGLECWTCSLRQLPAPSAVLPLQRQQSTGVFGSCLGAVSSHIW